jgi:hypothetical protein
VTEAPAWPIASANVAWLISASCCAWMSWFLAAASSALAREASTPGRSWLSTSV